MVLTVAAELFLGYILDQGTDTRLAGVTHGAVLKLIVILESSVKSFIQHISASQCRGLSSRLTCIGQVRVIGGQMTSSCCLTMKVCSTLGDSQ